MKYLYCKITFKTTLQTQALSLCRMQMGHRTPTQTEVILDRISELMTDASYSTEYITKTQPRTENRRI